MPKTQKQPTETFSSGAVRRKVTVISRTDLIPPEVPLAYGHRLHFGATVRGYGDRNWEKGIPYTNLIQHAKNHLDELAAQLISNPRFNFGKEAYNQNELADSMYKSLTDTPYGNASAALWNLAAIITFLCRGNPAAESK